MSDTPEQTGGTLVEQKSATVIPTRPSKTDWPPIILSCVVTVGYFMTLVFVLTQPIPKESERVIDVMIGTLTTVWIMTMTYFFSTTAGSTKKTDLLAKAGPVDPH